MRTSGASYACSTRAKVGKGLPGSPCEKSSCGSRTCWSYSSSGWAGCWAPFARWATRNHLRDGSNGGGWRWRDLTHYRGGMAEYWNQNYLVSRPCDSRALGQPTHFVSELEVAIEQGVVAPSIRAFVHLPHISTWSVRRTPGSGWSKWQGGASLRRWTNQYGGFRGRRRETVVFPDPIGPRRTSNRPCSSSEVVAPINRP